MPALPPLLCREAGRMRLVGRKAQPVRPGGCQRGAATRQGPRPTGPIGPDTWAANVVQLKRRELARLFNRVSCALATAGGLAAQVTGLVEATDLATTVPYEGCGQGPRPRQMTETRGHVQAIAGTVDGWTLIVRIEACTKIPLAAKGGPIHAHAPLSLRALVMPARPHLAGTARLHKGVCERGVGEGVDLWWLAQRDRRFVVPAKGQMAVTMEAQAQAAAGAGGRVGRRAHTVRHGRGPRAWTARLETEVVGLTGLTSEDQDGTPAHGRPHHRRACQASPIQAVVVRPGNGQADGPAGKTVFRTPAAVDTPLPPFDDDDDRRLIAHGGLKAATPPWTGKPPPQQTGRAGRVHVLFPWLLCAWATASRWPRAQEATGGAPVGWQHWRRQRREPTRDHIIVFAQGFYGICHLAADALRLGVNMQARPPEIGTDPHILAKYGRRLHRCASLGISDTKA